MLFRKILKYFRPPSFRHEKPAPRKERVYHPKNNENDYTSLKPSMNLVLKLPFRKSSLRINC